MKLAYFIPNQINEYSNKVLTTMLERFKPQTTDSEQQILQNMKRFEELSGAIAQKIQQKNPAVLRSIPPGLEQNNRFRDITQYKEYEDLVRVIKSVEKKDLDIYKQSITQYLKNNPQFTPAIIGMYVGQFKKKVKDIQDAVKSKDEYITDSIPKNIRPEEASNILAWRDFHALEVFIDSVFPFTNAEKGELNAAETDADLLYKNESTGIEVYKGDAEHKCIRYGRNQYYSWCISRNQGSFYFNYRLKNTGSLRGFYFVLDKNKTDDRGDRGFKEPTHAVVIHVFQNGKFKLTNADNNPGEAPSSPATWSELGSYVKGLGKNWVEWWDKIKGLEKYFVYTNPSAEERRSHGLKDQRLTLDEFIDLDIEDKQAWLRLNAHNRTIVNGEIIDSLNNEQINDLINSDRQFSFNELDKNIPLLKRYANYRYTRFPKEALPYPFIPYLKPELQQRYYDEFQTEYLNFQLIAKYLSPEIIDHYVETQVSRLGFLPKEAMEYMTPKQLTLYKSYSIAQSQFKILEKTQANQKDIIGTIKAPEQEGILNTPSAEYLNSLDEKEIDNFIQLVKSIKPKDKYVEFIFGVPLSINYQDKIYFYTPKNQNDNELDSESEWVITDQNGRILVPGLMNKSEEGLTFSKGGQKYDKFVGAEDYLVGSETIPLIAGKDFDIMKINYLTNKSQTFKVDNLGSILKESKDKDQLPRNFLFRAGIIK